MLCSIRIQCECATIEKQDAAMQDARCRDAEMQDVEMQDAEMQDSQAQDVEAQDVEIHCSAFLGPRQNDDITINNLNPTCF